MPANNPTTHNVRHGHSRRVIPRSRTYKTWCGMKTRCFNPNRDDYRLYGGRGITVCERWLTFENFLADMGERPEGMTLERKDPNENYEPDNCKWASPVDQSNNTRSNVLITYRGRTLNLTQWAKETGIDKTLLRKRFDKWGAADITFSAPRSIERTCLGCGVVFLITDNRQRFCARKCRCAYIYKIKKQNSA